MRKRIQKTIIIMTSCGLILTASGCGATAIADSNDGMESIVEQAAMDADDGTETSAFAGELEKGSKDKDMGMTESTETVVPEEAVTETGETKPAVDSGKTTSVSAAPASAQDVPAQSSGSGTSSSGTFESAGTVTDKTTAHTHDWVAVYKTVNYPEEGHYESVMVDPGAKWPIYEVHTICNGCGFDYDLNGVDIDDHFCDKHLSGYADWQVPTGEYQVFPPTYEEQWVVDKEAWSEQVVDYYQCSTCGQRK